MPNDGYLDKSVHWKIRSGNIDFHEPGFAEVADAILEAGLATEIGLRIGSGKEADVYCCRDGPRLVAVKVFRWYRTAHRGGGPIKLEAMGQHAVREFELLTYAWQGGARVPRPIERVENMFSMQYLGTAEAPAPILQHVDLAEPGTFLDLTLRGIESMAEAGIVHSDLSPFNILVHAEEPWFIDLAAGLRGDRLGASPWIQLSRARESLDRGLAVLNRYFRRYRIEFEAKEILERLSKQWDRFRVLES
jgi:RIO kinase 1